MTTLQKTISVLVVDDDSDQATSMALLLTEYGYESHVCLQAKNCMEEVERLRPQVVLLDLGMPGITGFDIAKQFQDNPDLRPTLLIAVTGHGQDLDRMQTKVYGFDHHLVKPLEFRHLDKIVKSVVLMD